jgi:hypothetical protein
MKKIIFALSKVMKFSANNCYFKKIDNQNKLLSFHLSFLGILSAFLYKKLIINILQGAGYYPSHLPPVTRVVQQGIQFSRSGDHSQ